MMLRKCKILFAVLPLIAMTAASGTFIRSLFYNFHNDTVPLFSIGISFVLAMICLVQLFFTVVCAVLYLGIGKNLPGNRDRASLLASACILNLGFGIFCAISKQSHFVTITVYLLLTSLSFALSYAFFRREQRFSGNHEKTEDSSQ